MSRRDEDTTSKFVTNYLQPECPWDVKSPHYNNTQLRQSDLENDMNIPGFDESQTKAKHKNIRSTYCQELKKDPPISGAGTSMFNASLRNIASELTDSESNSTDEENSLATTTDSEDNCIPLPTFREPKSQTIPNPKRKNTSQLSSTAPQLKELSETPNSTVEENEFEVFGRHIGLQLKSLPLLLALEAQEHIQLYINKIHRQYFKNTYQPQGCNTTDVTLRSSSHHSQYSPCHSNDTSTYSNEMPYLKDQSMSTTLLFPSQNVYNFDGQST